MQTAPYPDEVMLDRRPETRPSALVLGAVSVLRVCVHVSEGLMRFLPPCTLDLTYRFGQPTLLNIYDTYYLPLQHDLRPVMKSFILALLPGLEEETSEFFDKVRALSITYVLCQCDWIMNRC